jgi:hypothetical protein
MRRIPRLSYALLCLSILGIGCGSSNAPRQLSPETKGQEILGEVGEVYRIYSFDKKKPPKSLADLASLQAAQPVGYNAVKDGRVILLYGSVMTDLEEGPPKGNSDEVLAYEKEVPDQGGQVLMLDRSVKKMAADEFKAAKKAGKG